MAMNENRSSASFEVVTLPIGNGWRVRIADGERLQFIGGFDAKTAADDWVRRFAAGWLTKLKDFGGRL